MYQKIPRNLESEVRILGLTPVELTVCALFYALSSSALRGIPLSFLISIAASIGLGSVIFILNRTFPPYHGLLKIISILRNPVTSLMPFSKEGINE